MGNRYENGVWTYSLEAVWTGVQASYRNLCSEVLKQYNTPLRTVGAIGFSAMMHGYMAFDKDGNLLVPFRTWRNTTTGRRQKSSPISSSSTSPSGGALHTSIRRF